MPDSRLHPTRRLAALAIALSFLAGPALAGVITTDAPGNAATTPGDAASPAPLRYYGTGGSRSQVVYAASFFGGAESITGVSFRPYPGFTPSVLTSGTVTVSDLIVQLSTTSFGDETTTPLSATFAANTGANATTVYSGAATFHTAATGTPVRAFDYSLVFTAPFLYDPRAGNLLLDFQIPAAATVSGAGTGFGAFDTANDLNDGIYSVVNLNSGDATTGIPGTSGAIAQFTGTPVAAPEPMGVLILATGLAGLLIVRRRSRG